MLFLLDLSTFQTVKVVLFHIDVLRLLYYSVMAHLCLPQAIASFLMQAQGVLPLLLLLFLLSLSLSFLAILFHQVQSRVFHSIHGTVLPDFPEIVLFLRLLN